MSISPSGRVTGTQRIPGTGISYQQMLAPSAKGRKSRPARRTEPPVAMVLVRQPPNVVLRLLYFVAVGWWVTLIWWVLAAGTMCTLIGIPLGLRMFRATGQVLTLA